MSTIWNGLECATTKGFGTWKILSTLACRYYISFQGAVALAKHKFAKVLFLEDASEGESQIWSLKRCFNIQGIVINPVVRVHMDVSENSGTPKSSILIGCYIIKHPFWGTSIFGNTHIPIQYTEFRPWHYYWNVGNPQNLKMPHAQGSEACPNMRCDEADDTSNINDRSPACW